MDFGVDILGKQNKVFPVKLPMRYEDYKALLTKLDYINKHYAGAGLNEKREFVMSLNNEEVLLVKDIVNHIKKITNKTSKTHLTFKTTYSHHYSESYLENLIKELVIILDNNKEHIVGNNLNYFVDNKHDTKFDYYSGLGFSIEGLNECMCLKDLRDLATINKVPQYGKDGKLYSVFSRIRKPIRKHIPFRGSPLVEASDIRCTRTTTYPSPYWYMGSYTPYIIVPQCLLSIGLPSRYYLPSLQHIALIGLYFGIGLCTSHQSFHPHNSGSPPSLDA